MHCALNIESTQPATNFVFEMTSEEKYTYNAALFFGYKGERLELFRNKNHYNAIT